MSANGKNWELWGRLHGRGVRKAELSDAAILRRAEMTLHRWAERECGTDNGCVEVDDNGKAYWVDAMTGKRWPIRNLERGALSRVAQVCGRLGLHFYHQSDPRGAALYVGKEELNESNYTNGLCCSID